MKTFIVFSCLIAVCLTKGLPSEAEEPVAKNEGKVVWTPAAKFLLKEASLRAISFLCFGEQTNEQINEIICKKAIMRTNSETSHRATPSFNSNCIDCDVADPICWEACPQ